MKDIYDEGLCILARRDELTEKDWFDLLEVRRKQVAQHLREMTLKSLGDLKIVRDYKGGHNSARPLGLGGMVEKIRLTPPYRKYREESSLNLVPGLFSLDTRGIWPDDDLYHGQFTWEQIERTDGQPGTLGLITRFWGLTRNNEWLRIESTEKYFEQARHGGHDERMENRSEVTKLEVKETSPEEICELYGTTPRQIWRRLGHVVQFWLEHRLHQLEAIETLVETFKYEQTILEIVER